MISIPLVEAVLLVLLSGLFGWLLGKLPDRWVYGIAAATVLVALVVLAR